MVMNVKIGGIGMSRSAYYRKEVKNFKRESRKKVFVDGILDFLFMIFGISMITGVLLFVLGYWNYY
jgi:hypothetical protein